MTDALPTDAFSYEYDKNGNMVYDQYKNIRISYNILNLPDTITAEGQGKIVNQYLADGTLLRRSIFDADDNEQERIDYQGEFLFVGDELDKIFTEEGYYQPTEASKTKKSDLGTYFYTLADHLGHTRVVVDEDKNVIQETAYYPYGTPITALSSETKYNYLYTGKEFLDNFGLNWYDHHARYFDPEVGRWWAIDPALQCASPYMAMGNNPMMFTDADGRTLNPFKAIGQAWDYAWGKGNQFAQWVDEVGIPSFNMGVGMNSAGQISPLINGQAVNTNPYGSDQNTIAAINNARGDYFSQQQMNANYSQKLNNQIMSIPYSTVQRNRNTASSGGNEMPLAGMYLTLGGSGGGFGGSIDIGYIGDSKGNIQYFWTRNYAPTALIDFNLGGGVIAAKNLTGKNLQVSDWMGNGGGGNLGLGVISLGTAGDQSPLIKGSVGTGGNIYRAYTLDLQLSYPTYSLTGTAGVTRPIGNKFNIHPKGENSITNWYLKTGGRK